MFNNFRHVKLQQSAVVKPIQGNESSPLSTHRNRTNRRKNMNSENFFGHVQFDSSQYKYEEIILIVRRKAQN
jgi:hypothetical protein